MTVDQFKANDDMVKSWRDTLAKDETVKTVLQAMDESSPVYIDPPETKSEDAIAKYWFLRGYTFYHKTLQEMGKLPAIKKQPERNYGVLRNA